MQPINTAILSFGMSGRLFHAPFLQVHPGFEPYAVWERSKNLAQEVYPGIKTYRSYDDILADRNVELVIVNTPNYTHFDYAQKALQAGKHVVVEKPFTTTVSEGEALIQLAKANNLVLSVYQNRFLLFVCCRRAITTRYIIKGSGATAPPRIDGK